jgi:hypothetical protein
MTLFLATTKHHTQFTMNATFEGILIQYSLDKQHEIYCKIYEAKFTNKNWLSHALSHQVYFSRNSYHIVV